MSDYVEVLCKNCQASNLVPLGDLRDVSLPDVEGFLCHACGLVQWLPEVEELDPLDHSPTLEEAYVVPGESRETSGVKKKASSKGAPSPVTGDIRQKAHALVEHVRDLIPVRHVVVVCLMDLKDEQGAALMCARTTEESEGLVRAQVVPALRGLAAALEHENDFEGGIETA